MQVQSSWTSVAILIAYQVGNIGAFTLSPAASKKFEASHQNTQQNRLAERRAVVVNSRDEDQGSQSFSKQGQRVLSKQIKNDVLHSEAVPLPSIAMELRDTAEIHFGTFTKQAEDQFGSLTKSAEDHLDSLTKSAERQLGTLTKSAETYLQTTVEEKARLAEEYIESAMARALENHHHAVSFISLDENIHAEGNLPCFRTSSAALTDASSQSATSISTPKESANVERQSFAVSKDDLNVLFRFGDKAKEKIINDFGLFCAIVIVLTCIPWMATMSLLQVLQQIEMTKEFDPQRALYDATGKLWSRTWLKLTNSYPEITGEVQSVEQDGLGPVLFVANHASWLDIPILCCVLNPVFKFIAKGDLKKVPAVGQQLVGGNHILIDREDRRSQLRTFKEGLNWLNNGVSIMAFPEGARSLDGRLMKFKGGTFSMALKAGVPIVPLTICNAHAVMPTYSLFPIQPGKGKLALHVHPPIYPSNDVSDDDLSRLVRDAIMSKLPVDQKPSL